MARPRKDADAPDARTRIIEAFWELIENNSIFELSVGEVTRAAQCNRGTFYYYFHDFDELVAIAIAQLLQDNELITDVLWHFSSEGDLSAFDRRDVRCLLRRIVITMRAGAAEQVVQGIHTIIIDRVREIVHPDGEELKADSSFAVGFLVSGIMGFVMAVGFAREGGEEIDLEQLGDSACAYLRAVAMQTVETVAQVEGVDTSELLERVSKEADVYRASRATSPDVVKDA